ncbi:MAG TPA: hypothetical protein VIJ68_04190 [Candidatus Saccharimonadales bacterium]
MTERTTPPEGDPGHAARGFNNSPKAVIEAYLELVKQHPEPLEIAAAGGLIQGPWRPFENTRDAYSICLDIAARMPNVTTILATMFDTNDEAIPKSWRMADATRMVLLMAGDIESGNLRAQQRTVMRGPSFPGLPERLGEVEQFVSALEA